MMYGFINSVSNIRFTMCIHRILPKFKRTLTATHAVYYGSYIPNRIYFDGAKVGVTSAFGIRNHYAI